MSKENKVAPLTQRTMTLDELQTRVLKVIRQTRKHLNTPSWLGGQTDREFEEVLNDLANDIKTDRLMMKQNATREDV